MSKKIFFKTVRSDGTSVWAPYPLNKKYEIGKNYRFSKKLPAHVFLKENSFGLIDIYQDRYEYSGGNRVLICWGETNDEMVTKFNVSENEEWFENKIDKNKYKKWVQTSNDFDVIGEIFVPQSWIVKEKSKLNIKWVPLQKSLDGVGNKH